MKIQNKWRDRFRLCSTERTGMAGTTVERRRLGISGYNGCWGCGDGWSSFTCLA